MEFQSTNPILNRSHSSCSSQVKRFLLLLFMDFSFLLFQTVNSLGLATSEAEGGTRDAQETLKRRAKQLEFSNKTDLPRVPRHSLPVLQMESSRLAKFRPLQRLRLKAQTTSATRWKLKISKVECGGSGRVAFV